MNTWEIREGDVLDRLREMPDESVHCVVTSPPYWGLRDYGTAEWDGGDAACDHQNERQPRTERARSGLTGSLEYVAAQEPTYRDVCGKCGARRVDRQIGLEPTPAAYLARMVEVFREVRRVLRSDGTCWVNMGDGYTTSMYSHNSLRTVPQPNGEWSKEGQRGVFTTKNAVSDFAGLKPKDLIGMPWRLAFALQDDGWWLRSEIIWAKPNPMPESVTDRPTKAHEQIFLLAKSAKYFYDADAIREPMAEASGNRERFIPRNGERGRLNTHMGSSFPYQPTGTGRNARSVWTIATQAFSGAPLLADYVGADGKPYRRSPDCPIHGQQDRLETPRTGECDEQPDRSLSDNPGSDFHPDGELSGGRASICETTSGRTDDESERQQTRESKEKSKTLALTPTHSAGGRVGDARSAIDTMHIPERHGPRDGSSDSPDPASADAASPHSNETHKTGRAPATSQPCMPSAETLGSTAGTSALPGFDVLSGHTPENSNGQGDSADLPSAQTKRRIVDRPSQCNCTIVNVDHFATFPEELPRRCILAGTSERGVCPQCGAPWRRVVEREYVKSPVHGAGSVVGRHDKTGANGYDGSAMPRAIVVSSRSGVRASSFSM